MSKHRVLHLALPVACLVLAAGCSSSSGGGSTGGSSTSGGSTKSTGSSGSTGGTSASGSLTIGSNVAPPTLDLTSNAAAAIDEVLDYNVYQHLVQLAPNGSIVPVLASSYAWSNGNKTVTFTLQSGVKFSNGDPLTAQDVVYSINRVIAPKSSYPYASLMGKVTSVTAPTPSTVAVTLSAPNNEWLYQLAAYSNGVILDPKAVSTIATAPVGTGPYEFSNEVQNYSVSLKANPDYWGSPKPGVGTVTFRYFSSSTAENAALLSNQIQVIDDLTNPPDVKQFESNPAYKIVHGPTNGKIQLTLNNDSGPLKSVQVRQAINYAIDKQAILTTVGAGYGTVIGSDTVPGDPWYSASYAQAYPYDPAKAKQLLAESGQKNISLTLTIPPYGYAESAAPLVAADLQAVGIKVTVKDIQWPLWLSQVFTARNFDMTIIDHVEARDIGNYAIPDYYWNYGKTSQVAALLAAGDAAPTQAGQVAKYTQVLQMITADAVNAWLYNPDQITVAAKDVVGLPGSGQSESFNLQYLSIGGTLPAQGQQQGFSG
jgi:peptide/nickel transport system substrate-binding protein